MSAFLALVDEWCPLTAWVKNHDLHGVDGEPLSWVWCVTDKDWSIVRIIPIHHDFPSGGKFGTGTLADSGVL